MVGGFSADVVIFGVRLASLIKLICEHQLALMRPVCGRYSQLNPEHSCVAEILIRKIDKSGAP